MKNKRIVSRIAILGLGFILFLYDYILLVLGGKIDWKKFTTFKSSLISSCFYSSPIFTLEDGPDYPVSKSTSSWLSHSSTLVRWSLYLHRADPSSVPPRPWEDTWRYLEASVQAYIGLLLLPFALTCHLPGSWLLVSQGLCLSPSSLSYWPLDPGYVSLSLYKLSLSHWFLIDLLIWLEWMHLVCVKSQSGPLLVYSVQSLNTVMLSRNHPYKSITKTITVGSATHFQCAPPIPCQICLFNGNCESSTENVVIYNTRCTG